MNVGLRMSVWCLGSAALWVIFLVLMLISHKFMQTFWLCCNCGTDFIWGVGLVTMIFTGVFD